MAWWAGFEGWLIMAQPPAYPAQGAFPSPGAHPPPAAYAYQPPAAAGASVTVQQAPPKQEKKGMFSSFMKEMDKVGKQISKEIDYASAKVNEAVDKNYSSALLYYISISTAIWIVTNEGNNQVRLHNCNNYLAIENGHTIVKPFPAGSVLGPETRFQLSQMQFQFVTLESLQHRGEYVGFLPSGESKPSKGTLKDNSTQFGVKLLVSGG
ncbi:hypothetical protein EGW08_013395 [Elysia chlorotica]|uniref:Uncharacterized protein n=1 Tax=Elysia chlorotica TaxID=188477 RepID=A0A433TB75_ELYCH|nr:hypothetical protein EGW08_013395 [Elysia chlorotica]